MFLSGWHRRDEPRSIVAQAGRETAGTRMGTLIMSKNQRKDAEPQRFPVLILGVFASLRYGSYHDREPNALP